MLSFFIGLKNKLWLGIIAVLGILVAVFKFRGDYHKNIAENAKRIADIAEANEKAADRLVDHAVEHQEVVNENEKKLQEHFKSGSRDYFNNTDGGM